MITARYSPAMPKLSARSGCPAPSDRATCAVVPYARKTDSPTSVPRITDAIPTPASCSVPRWPTIAASTSRNVGSASSAPSAGTASRRICAFRPGSLVTGAYCSSPLSSPGQPSAGLRRRTRLIVIRAVPPATRRMAATDRSTSASVVDQLDTEIRISRRPRQEVPPSQQVPSRCTPSIDRIGAGVGAEPDQHLVEHDVVDAPRRRRPRSPSANRRASAQQRSTSSATPSEPSSRSAAQAVKPLARRDDSRTKSDGEATPPAPTR